MLADIYISKIQYRWCHDSFQMTEHIKNTGNSMSDRSSAGQARLYRLWSANGFWKRKRGKRNTDFVRQRTAGKRCPRHPVPPEMEIMIRLAICTRVLTKPRSEAHLTC